MLAVGKEVSSRDGIRPRRCLRQPPVSLGQSLSAPWDQAKKGPPPLLTWAMQDPFAVNVSGYFLDLLLSALPLSSVLSTTFWLALRYRKRRLLSG